MQFGCLVLFGLPFLLVGVGFTTAGIASLLIGSPGGAGNSTGFLLALGLPFLSAGLAVTGTGTVGVVRAVLRGRRRKRFPEEPWKHSGDFVGLRVRGGGRTFLVILWAAAAGVLLFVGPFFLRFDEFRQSNPWIPVVVFGLFGLLVVLLFVFAVRRTLAYVRYGAPELHLEQVPVAPGGRLRGVVVVRAEMKATSARVTLRLDRTTTHRTGGKTVIRTETVRTEQRVVPATDFRTGPSIVGIPVEFDLSPDAPENGDENASVAWAWSLGVAIDSPVSPLVDSFPLPIWRSRGVPIERRMEPYPV